MKYLLLAALCGSLSACADSKHTTIKEICSEDSPAIVLPDEVVCNHAPANNIEVVGHRIKYMCTKIGGKYETD